ARWRRTCSSPAALRWGSHKHGSAWHRSWLFPPGRDDRESRLGFESDDERHPRRLHVVAPFTVLPLGIPDDSRSENVQCIAHVQIVLLHFFDGMIGQENETGPEDGVDQPTRNRWLQRLRDVHIASKILAINDVLSRH